MVAQIKWFFIIRDGAYLGLFYVGKLTGAAILEVS